MCHRFLLRKSCVDCIFSKQVTFHVLLQFLNPGILVKKPAKLPDGHINTWFWEKGNMEETLKTKVPKGVIRTILAYHKLFTSVESSDIGSKLHNAVFV